MAMFSGEPATGQVVKETQTKKKRRQKMKKQLFSTFGVFFLAILFIAATAVSSGAAGPGDATTVVQVELTTRCDVVPLRAA